MAKKNHISHLKKAKIISNILLNNSVKGTFFNIKKPQPEDLIPIVRLSTPIDKFTELISEFENNPVVKKYIVNSHVKKEIKDLQLNDLIYIDLESEYTWAKIILSKNLKKIESFLNLSRQYSNYLFHGNFGEANNILNKIEADFGYSMWLIKNKIGFLQLTQGLEAQKSYTQKVKKELINGRMVSFITHWTSVRNEKQTTFVRFSQQIENICLKLDDETQKGYKEYIRYHLLGKDDLNPEKFIHVLRLEYSKSLIDYYEAFVAFVRVLSVNSDKKFSSKIINTLNNNKFLIDDDRLEIIKCLLKLSSFNQFTHRDFINVYEEKTDDQLVTNNHLVTHSSDYDSQILLISKFINIGLSDEKITEEQNLVDDSNISLKDIIAKKLARIIKYGIVASSEDFNDLKKIHLNFSNFSWAAILNIALNKEEAVLNELNKENEILALKVPFFHPFFIDCFNESYHKSLYEKKCLDIYTESSYLNYSLSLANLNEENIADGFADVALDLLKGLISFKRNFFDRAIEFGEKLILSENPYYKRRGFAIISYSYLELGNYKMSSKTIGDCYVNNLNFYPFLPLTEICEKVKSGSSEWKTVKSIIDFSIVLDAYYKHINKNLETEKRFAYEDFLLANEMEKPSDLENNIGKFELNKIIYYLRFVCVESTMDTSGVFDGSNEVVQERLQVCRILVNIDKVNEEIYRKEINEIVRRQVIASRKKEVDQSRIYVDINSVKSYSEAELKESFNRYVAYLKFNINVPLINDKKRDQIVDLTINTPINEVHSLLRYMVEEIRDAYLSPDFGLDRFLSTRIRHGILEGHLRRPFQNHNLITSKEFKNGPYQRNNYWLNKLTSKEYINKFNTAFSKFSESYDGLIGTIITWLQINKKGGIINFSISEDDIKNISSKLSKESTLKEFIELIITFLEETLIVHLIAIREELNGTAKTKAKKLLNELQDATFINNNQTSKELLNSISQARTDLQVQFDKIIEWFIPPSTGTSAPYIIEDALVVAEAQIKEVEPKFKIEIVSDEADSFEIHGHLPIFVDIFVNIFENVVKRSELFEPKASVMLSVSEIRENLVKINFEISNELGPTVNIAELDKEMQRKMALLDKESYTQYLATERNSGLFKIHKSVKDFKAMGYNKSATVNFGVKNNLFLVSISIPFNLYSLDTQ